MFTFTSGWITHCPYPMWPGWTAHGLPHWQKWLASCGTGGYITESLTWQICELEARSRSYDDQCLPHQLGGPRWICLSSFTLIGKCFQKVRKEWSTIMLVTSPMLMELMTELPLLLPDQKNILIHSKGQMHPLVDFNRLRLATWINLQQQHATTCNNRSFWGNFTVIASGME